MLKGKIVSVHSLKNSDKYGKNFFLKVRLKFAGFNNIEIPFIHKNIA